MGFSTCIHPPTSGRSRTRVADPIHAIREDHCLAECFNGFTWFAIGDQGFTSLSGIESNGLKRSIVEREGKLYPFGLFAFRILHLKLIVSTIKRRLGWIVR